MDWLLLFKALCLVMVIEGIPLFLTPGQVREAASMVLHMDDRTLRLIGLIAMFTGAGILTLLSG